jgi:hypothetical protein
MALGRKTGGRTKGLNKLDEGKRFVIHVERLLSKGGYQEGLANLVCRQLAKPEMCNPILLKLLEYKFGKPKENHEHDHKHIHVEMTIDDAKQLIRGYFGQLTAGRDIEVGASDSDDAAKQDNELLS